MNIRISGASEQNGDAAREVNRAYTLKICLRERAQALTMVEFSEGKFILYRELFLTKSSVSRTECSIPFCDRGVFRMFISSTASCTYNKVCFSVTFIIMKLPMLVADIRISGARSRMDMLPDYFEAAATSKN